MSTYTATVSSKSEKSDKEGLERMGNAAGAVELPFKMVCSGWLFRLLDTCGAFQRLFQHSASHEITIQVKLLHSLNATYL